MLPVPFLGPFQRPICPGTIVRISASTPPNANLFNINLQCGPSVNPRDDVAFHLSIDFNSFTVFMNSIVGRQWGHLEKCTGEFPFRRERNFFIDITCDQSAFLVNVNGIGTGRFEHRVEPLRISHLAIDGDLILRNCELLGGTQEAVSGTLPNTLSSAGLPPTPSYQPSTIKYYLSGDISPAPCPIGWFQYPTHPPAPYQQQMGSCLQQSKPYPQQPYINPGHPRYLHTPGMYQPQTVLYPQQPVLNPSQSSPYPQQLEQAATVFPVPTSSQQPKKKITIDKEVLENIGGVVGGAASSGILAMKKMAVKLGKLAKKSCDKLT